MTRLNKKGLTIAEAVISMVLLAIVTMGIYGVILASVRSGKKPDMREDMSFAIETASSKLKGLLANPVNCVLWKDGAGDDCHGNVITSGCCLLWDACAVYAPDGSCANCPTGQDVYGDGRVCGIADRDAAIGSKVFFDLCGRKLTGAGAAFALKTGTAGQSGAKTPFTPCVDYYVDFMDTNKTDLCMLPESCTDRAHSYFYYTVSIVNDTANCTLDPSKIQYLNIQFHISCNGQTI